MVIMELHGCFGQLRLHYPNNFFIRIVLITVLFTLMLCQAQNVISLTPNQCHYCDLCKESSFSNTLPLIPQVSKVENCSNNVPAEQTACLTMSVHYEDQGGIRNKYKADYIRHCLKNGTIKCLEKHVGPILSIEKCLKTKVTGEVYAKYLACSSAHRIEEWETNNHVTTLPPISKTTPAGATALNTSTDMSPGEISELFSPDNEKNKHTSEQKRTAEYTEIAVCACTGKLCNTHTKLQLEKAAYVGQEKPGKSGTLLHVVDLVHLLGLAIMIILA